jgi:organic hydroperoxide reductase OsmC/OhrA
MSEHRATIQWKRVGADFLKGKYSREHTWRFDGGVTVPASPSPSVVPPPYSNPASVDPEEAFVASISSCHMLTYLFVAPRGGFQVDSYEDEAVGVLTKNEHGVPWVSAVTPSPRISYGGEVSVTGRRGAAASRRARTVLHREFHQDRGRRQIARGVTPISD